MARRKKKKTSTRSSKRASKEPTRPEVEPFTLDKAELFELLYAEERVARLGAEIAKLQEMLKQEAPARDSIRSVLVAKYTEQGKYVFVGTIDKETCQGERVLASEAELLNEFMRADAVAAQAAADSPAPITGPSDESGSEDDGSEDDSDEKEARRAELQRELDALD